jgi:hypothetical protein
MIIDDFHIHGAEKSFRPPETDPPLIVDADRKLSGALTFERFESVARQSRQIGKAFAVSSRSRRISACREKPENSLICRPEANRSAA